MPIKCIKPFRYKKKIKNNTEAGKHREMEIYRVCFSPPKGTFSTCA